VDGFMRKIGLGHISTSSKISRLSGGEKQRVLVSRAFISKPKFVAADEPTTMVDFIHRNEILGLLQGFKNELKTSILFITHDLSLASYLADRVAIMYRGRIVEIGTKPEMMESPLHPYTQALFSVTPDKLVSESRKSSFRAPITTNLMDTWENACGYRNSCPYAFEKCHKATPTLQNVGGDHLVACFKYTQEEI
jgi:peptide/nickel transport system ATP-binding protein